MRALGAIALALIVMAVPCIAQDTLKPGDTISGKLRFFQHQHPNGTWINVYQITVDNPKKFAVKDEFCDDKVPPKTFHLVVMDDKAKKKRLDKMLGKTIAVVAEDFSCSETAWHVGDAVVFQWHFAEPAKR
jgi:transcription termination factor Rho